MTIAYIIVVATGVGNSRPLSAKMSGKTTKMTICNFDENKGSS